MSSLQEDVRRDALKWIAVEILLEMRGEIPRFARNDTSLGFKRDNTFVGGALSVFRPHPQPLSHGVGEGSRVPATRCGFPLSRVAGEGGQLVRVQRLSTNTRCPPPLFRTSPPLPLSARREGGTPAPRAAYSPSPFTERGQGVRFKKRRKLQARLPKLRRSRVHLS